MKLKQNMSSFKSFLAAALLILLAVTAFARVFTHKANAAAVNENEYANYIGKSLSRSALPAWLKDDAEKKAGVEEKFKAAYLDMVENKNFDMGKVYPDGSNYGIRLWNDYLIQEFREGDHRISVYSRVHGNIVLGVYAENISAACVVNEIFQAWAGNMGNYGFPVENQFSLNGAVYQNFSGGFAKLQNNNVQFTAGKNIAADGSDLPLPRPVVAVGDMDGYIPDWGIELFDETRAGLIAGHNYLTTTGAIKAGGFDLGYADNYASNWDNVVVSQRFAGGENRGNPYNWGVQGRIMINDGHGRAFALVNNFLTTWATKGGFSVVGYPMSDMFAHEGKTIQVFSGRTLIVDELGYPNEYYINPGSYTEKFASDNEAAKYAPIMRAGFFDEYKAYNNKLLQISGAAVAKNLGYAADYISLFDGTDVYYQAFIGGDSGYEGKAYIMQSGLKGRAHSVTGDSLEAWTKAGGASAAGAPLSGVFGAGGKEYQNFAKGYINITSKTFVSGKRMNRSGTESDLTAAAQLHTLTGISQSGVSAAGFDTELVYSLISERVKELAEAGYNAGTPLAKADRRETWVEQVFENGDSSAARAFSADCATLIVVNGAASVKAYSVKDAFLVKYRALSDTAGFCGAPMGEEFAYGRRVYQNFKNGYMAKDSYGLVTYTKGLWINSDGNFVESATGKAATGVPDSVGKFGDISRVPMKFRSKEAEVKAAFQAEYARLMKEGFFPGETDEELVHGWAPGAFEWINQTFKIGDSNAMNVYGNNRAMKIFMIDLDKGAFSVYGDMMAAWVQLGGLDRGYPLGNQFVANGRIYQNFVFGYIEVPAGSPGSAVFHEGLEITPEQVEKDNGGGGNGLGLWWVLIIGGPAVLAGGAVAVFFVLKKRPRKTNNG